MGMSFRRVALTLTPPLLSVGLLAGIFVEQRTHLKPQAVEPYHARAKAAVDQVPYFIGTWTGQDDEIPVAAQKLLRPNAILSRTFIDSSPGDSRSNYRSASLLIVQCRDSRDMVGHYPPICYRAHGLTIDEKSCGPRDWSVNGKTIPGYEYHFTEVFQGRSSRTTVYNFLIVPQRGIVRDMKGVEQAAEDYEQRYYGAAQFQVVFQSQGSAERSREERDEIFATLMGPNIPLIETLTSGVLK
ncbi:MAG: hypothetical protein QOF78_3376 [Phycisphaerales bacterium]|jgi:hypothetical protein|nr:hypothetical protein [Phycisphaerales bacterium]MEA2734668.1 hypothetical protein [Humisphaera sp.]